jgi:hypothetical protein
MMSQDILMTIAGLLFCIAMVSCFTSIAMLFLRVDPFYFLIAASVMIISFLSAVILCFIERKLYGNGVTTAILKK